MEASQNIKFRTSDIEEAVAAISKIYCPHQMELPRSYCGLSTTLEVVQCGLQPVVGLKYSTPVSVDAGRFPNLMLMQTCIDGKGLVRQGGISAVCRPNETLPLSPDVSTQLDFDARYVQRTVRLDIERLETLCSRWLNAPLEHPFRFELRPFSRQLEQAWAQAVTLMLAYERMNIILPEAAATSFDEFMLSLVLQQHLHNYSNDLRRPPGPVAPRVVREAEHWMRIGGSETSVSGIAARMGVSLRNLEVAFREWRQATPTQCLRKIRLEAARAELLDPSGTTSVTAVALNKGFFHLARFSAYYRVMFGEPPGPHASTEPPSKRMIFPCRRSRVGFTHQARVSRILFINKLPEQTHGRYCNGCRITIRSTGAPNSGAVIVTAAITFVRVIAGLNIWATVQILRDGSSSRCKEWRKLPLSG